MKRIVSLLLCVIMMVLLCGCGGGKTSGVEVTLGESELYSQEEVASGVAAVKHKFGSRDWAGCTLKKIKYAGDKVSKDHHDWAERNDLDEVMVFLSEFDVDEKGGGQGALNPNSTYTDYMWILARKGGGSWRVVDGGY